MIDYAAILMSEYPNSQWALDGDDYSGLIWLSDDPKPSKADLDAAWPSVQAASELAAVQSARSARYKSESDPLFFKWQRGEGTEADWLAAVDKIRADLPYPA